MNQESKIIADWIARCHKIDSGSLDLASDAPDETDWAYEALYQSCKIAPEKALGLIVRILESDSSDVVVDNLAAGPLESLLMWNSQLVIDSIESLAASDARFRDLLDGVWQNNVPDPIWSRIRKAATSITPINEDEGQ